MSEQTNKTTGGVWVACSERLPEKRHACSHDNIAIRGSDGSILFWPRRLLPRGNNWHWLDTTVEIVTREEHDAAIKQLLDTTEPLRLSISRNELIDELTNMIDKAIRKQSLSPYDEWQNAVEAVVRKHCELKGGTNGD